MNRFHFSQPTSHHSEKGQSLVELAIGAVVLITLMAGVIDFGLAFINFVAMRDAAQEGAIYGSLHPDQCTQIEAHARESAQALLIGVNVEIHINGYPCGSANAIPRACAGNEIRVTVSQPHYPISMPFLSSILGIPGNELNLRAQIRDTILTPYNATCLTAAYP